MRVRLVRFLLWSAGFGLLWVPVLDEPPLATASYVQDVTTNSAVVAIVLPAPAQVEGTLWDGDALVATARGPEGRRRNALRFEGLEAGKRYRYSLAEVGGGEIGTGTVTTAPADERAAFRFVFLGDSGDQPWWVWLQTSPLFHLPARWHWLPCSDAVCSVGSAVAAWSPDLVLHLGDVIYPKGLNAHYSSGFFRPFEAVMRNVPVYAVLGNHDVMDSDGVQFLSNLRLPSSGATGDGRMFSLGRGPVRIIGLDCNTDRTGSRYDAQHPAHAFLTAELAKATEPWVIVASHFPMRSWSRQGNRAELLLGMLPELQRQGVSMYLSGHDHCYQRFGDPGAGEPVLVVSGGGGKDLYDIKPKQPGPAPAAAAKAYHWGCVEVVGGSLRVEARGLDGARIDAFELPLPSGDSLARIRVLNPGRAERIQSFGNR